ncbi:hypothetical protein HNP52_000307 [Sphingomonas kyeonggiensis]|uniref:Tyr recombinase domain-containing protein n=1 Tax=Sphingomonas kyeonggiensis TaxID=1268553 RepID=A0A7W7NR10_9SPHN|nr:tyrosine-type recombinase/integrase [Sphingomonas kyeonggiensis]MBB4837256.1 hypothetical protein [Sphingomonas kyeonggiensis]
MASAKLPAYVNPRRLAGGKTGYFWCRPAWADPKLAASKDELVRRKALRNGKTCPVESTALGTDLPEAIVRARVLNETFSAWRLGEQQELTHGTVAWLFDWYRKQDRFTSKRHQTRVGYRKQMDFVEAMAMKIGAFGQRQAGAVDGPVADKLYKNAIAKHGERTGSYMMQVCRLVWSLASRPGYSKLTGVKVNPFKGMGIVASSGHGKGNRAATRAEYDLYRETARAMGRQSMATAAALCFETCQRVFDVFGIADPDGRVVRGFWWADYKPGVSIRVVQSKTGKSIMLPLVDGEGDDAVPLYPELEEELARTWRPDAAEGEPQMIVVNEGTGKPYSLGYVQKLHRQIRIKAGLPADLRFTSFRHGGLTEIGDSGEADMRAVSGHSEIRTTKIYDKASQEKARRIAVTRRAHIEKITGGSTAEQEP